MQLDVGIILFHHLIVVSDEIGLVQIRLLQGVKELALLIGVEVPGSEVWLFL
ncbi:MAG: hypothetical protein ACOZBL_05775 [Patescibacteria group bacterium]